MSKKVSRQVKPAFGYYGSKQRIANKIIELLENEKDLSNSVESYQKLLKLNKIIEKEFHKNLRNVNEETKNKVKEIIKKNDKKV